MGTPVIAFDAGGVRDSLEGCPAGRLVKGTAEMAADIIHMLNNNDVLEQMSKAGPSWVAEKFGRERMTEDYYRFFASLVKNADT
jgi:glycosyltransferase involved in cell wall biosynthesis